MILKCLPSSISTNICLSDCKDFDHDLLYAAVSGLYSLPKTGVHIFQQVLDISGQVEKMLCQTCIRAAEQTASEQ